MKGDRGATALIARFQRARASEQEVVLEGFHALKHALRFGATVHLALTTDRERLASLVAELAPDLETTLGQLFEVVSDRVFTQLGPHEPHTRVLAVASRPVVDVASMLASPRPAPVVLLENPRDLGNIGAAIRVAAAADAAGLLTTGAHDPWSEAALRGSAGLHYALAVARVGQLPSEGRPLVAIDPKGEELGVHTLPRRAILCFGSERHGLSAELLRRTDARVRIPMRSGVSSLNLATAVAAVLFALRPATSGPPSAA